MVSLPLYETQIVPALRRIQERYGFLKRDALQQVATELALPLHRLHAVASFFPHFRFTPPPRVTVRVCRDMACGMAGAKDVIAEVDRACRERAAVERQEREKAGKPVGDNEPPPAVVEGASCLGRCDRPCAAVISVHRQAAGDAAHAGGHGHEEEYYYHARSREDLARIAMACVDAADGKGPVPPQDTDVAKPMPFETWVINPYGPAGGPPAGASPAAVDGATPAAAEPPEPYAAAKMVATARLVAIEKATDFLKDKQKWPRDRAEIFGLAAARRGLVEFPLDDDQRDAVRAFQTCDDWADNAEMGRWSDAILKELDDAHADLRGMGGAGIPATQKWKDVRDAVRSARRRRTDDRAFIVVNGDESEPGTFKDRELLLRTPELIVEGVIIAGLLTDATEGFIYIRHEYPEQIAACEAAIRKAEKIGVCGATSAVALGRPFRVSVFVSPGGYICGEQSALIEAMSDRRGEPRNMPPKLETNGLDDRPTLVSNVETYGWVPYILVRGGEAYAKLGVNGWKGRRFFSISGDVNRPGVYEVPMGLTVRDLIYGEQYCQGMKGNRPVKAMAPSGPSGGFIPLYLTAKAGLPRDHTKNRSWGDLAKRRKFDPAAESLNILDLELELNLFRALSPTQALGAGVVIYADNRDMAEQAVNSIEFYKNESCGKCVPCRIGSQKLAALGNNLLGGRIDATVWEKQLWPAVTELGKVMELSSICGLGRSVPVPLKTVVDYFKADLGRRLTGTPPPATTPRPTAARPTPTTATAVAATVAPPVAVPSAAPASPRQLQPAVMASPPTIVGTVPAELRTPAAVPQTAVVSPPAVAPPAAPPRPRPAPVPQAETMVSPPTMVGTVPQELRGPPPAARPVPAAPSVPPAARPATPSADTAFPATMIGTVPLELRGPSNFASPSLIAPPPSPPASPMVRTAVAPDNGASAENRTTGDRVVAGVASAEDIDAAADVIPQDRATTSVGGAVPDRATARSLQDPRPEPAPSGTPANPEAGR